MDVLKRPVITEKSSEKTEDLGQYTFVVDKKATKGQIKAAIQEFYQVKVSKVNTINYLGKKKSRFTKTRFVEGKNNDYKKAIITLAEGDVIDFYDNL